MLIKLSEGPIQTKWGEWTLSCFWDGNKESLVACYGDISSVDRPLCRLHSSCITAHVFSSVECDCQPQIEIAMSTMKDNGAGIIIWLDQEGRGNGIPAHVASQALKRHGYSQSEAYQILGCPRDGRDYRTGANILKALNISKVYLLTNNPLKIDGLKSLGIDAERYPKQILTAPDNTFLLKQYKDKRDLDGHLIDMPLNFVTNNANKM